LDQISTLGYSTLVGRNLVVGEAKKESIVAGSHAEADLEQ